MTIPNKGSSENQSLEESTPKPGGMELLHDAIKQQLEVAINGEENSQNEQPGDDHQEDDQASETEVIQDDESLENAEEHHDEEPGQDKGNRGWQKRIDKLTARNKSIEELNDALRQEVYELKKQSQDQPERPVSVNELATRKQTVEELEQLESEAVEAERWAKRNLAKYKRDPDAVEAAVKERTGNVPEDVEQFLEDILFNSEDLLRSDIPYRKKQIIDQKKHFEEAAKHYPWLNNPRSEPAAWVNNILTEFGDKRLSEIPDVHRMIARALVGQYIEQEKVKKSKVQQPTPEPTKQPGKPAVQRRQMNTGENELLAARKRVEKERTPDAMAQWIKQRANLRT